MKIIKKKLALEGLPYFSELRLIRPMCADLTFSRARSTIVYIYIINNVLYVIERHRIFAWCN